MIPNLLLDWRLYAFAAGYAGLAVPFIGKDELVGRLSFRLISSSVHALVLVLALRLVYATCFPHASVLPILVCWIVVVLAHWGLSLLYKPVTENVILGVFLQALVAMYVFGTIETAIARSIAPAWLSLRWVPLIAGLVASFGLDWCLQAAGPWMARRMLGKRDKFASMSDPDDLAADPIFLSTMKRVVYMNQLCSFVFAAVLLHLYFSL